jgi:hypothetical protein
VAGTAAPWILERDKRTSSMVNGLTGDAEYVAAGGKGSAAAGGKGRRPRAGTEFWRLLQYAGWTHGGRVGDLFLFVFYGVRIVVCTAIM